MKKRDWSSFTLLELIIVLVLAGLVFSLVVPRVGHLPREIAREQLFSKIERAFRYAGTRARATGQRVRVRVNKEQNAMTLRGSTEGERQQSAENAEMDHTEKADQPPSFLPDVNTIKLPDKVKWQKTREQGLGKDRKTHYTFFPGGEAAGPSLRIKFRGENYNLRIDELTGTPVISRVDRF